MPLLKRAILVLYVLVIFLPDASPAREKVLLDTDMVEAFDDGVAMIMLANAPGIDLVGVTTVSGNSWVEEGTAYALRQLEIEGRQSVPVAIGLNVPLHPQRHERFEQERQTSGLAKDAWVGCLDRLKPATWRDTYRERYGREPSLQPSTMSAVDFIINAVRAHPDEITIAVIGPCGNLARAVRKAPDIIPLVRRVVYMGGAFFRPGNVTPAAEFNWWFDPEAARIAVRTPFREQIVFGLDVCEKIEFRREHYERLLNTLGKSPQADILRSTFLGQSFEKEPAFSYFVWDVLVAAAIIDPSLITRVEKYHVDVIDEFGPSYGQALASSEQPPAGGQEFGIVLDIDQKRFWDMLNDPVYWISAR